MLLTGSLLNKQFLKAILNEICDSYNYNFNMEQSLLYLNFNVGLSDDSADEKQV